jgi:integrase
MAKKRTAKWRAWNKGLEIGQKDAFTPAQVKRIRQVLAHRGVPGLRDLALFSVAIDTMLQGPELLNLTVKDVALVNGTIRPVIEVARSREPPVRCALSMPTAKALGKWIAQLCSGTPASWASRASSRIARTRAIVRDGRRTGSKARTQTRQR